MGQQNLLLLEDATFGVNVQIGGAQCSEYQGELNLMTGPMDTLSLQVLANDDSLELPLPQVCFFGEATGKYSSCLMKVTKRTGTLLTGVDPIGNVGKVQLKNGAEAFEFVESETYCLHRIYNAGGGALMILY
eukprot:6470947-Amphidinium_carterae.1